MRESELMRFMLDTCAFIDAVTEPDNLYTTKCPFLLLDLIYYGN